MTSFLPDRKKLAACIFCAVLTWPALQAAAHEDEAGQGEAAAGIGVEEKLGEKIPSDAVFLDEQGSRILPGARSAMPTLILPVYYSCRQTCGLLLENLAAALSRVPQAPGRQYRVFALSIDDEDTPASALQAKRNYLNAAGGDRANSWKFLTGDRVAINQLTGAMGFMFKKTGKHEFAHPNVLIALAPDGTIIRYLYGPFFLPFDIGMAITEADRGTPEISVRKLVSYCFVYDGEKKTYTFAAVRILALGSLLAVGIIMGILLRKRDS